ALFVAEVFGIYHAFVEGKPSPLRDLPMQYGDYAAWRERFMKTSEYARQTSYWKRRMTDAAPLALPFDRLAPSVRTANAHTVVIPLTSEMIERMDQIARSESASRFAVAAAVFSVFLADIASQRDVVVLAVTSSAQARAPELSSLFGCFLDLLVLRTEVADGLSFRDLVRTVRQRVAEAQSNTDVSASAIMGDEAVFDAPAARALLNVLEYWPTVPAESGGLTIARSEVRLGPRVAEIAWNVVLPSSVSVLSLSSDVFDAATAEHFGRSLSALLHAVLASSEATLGELRREIRSSRD
ncbi:MAG: condensation domain-containing protein, partial [Polyangiaceae bacterium]